MNIGSKGAGNSKFPTLRDIGEKRWVLGPINRDKRGNTVTYIFLYVCLRILCWSNLMVRNRFSND